jgi:glycosyltransferase involved in cell wall biosynthesis
VLTYQRGRTTDLNRTPSKECFDNYSVIRLGPFFKTAGADQDIVLNDKHKAFFRRRFVDNAVALFNDETPDIVFSMYLLNAGFLATHIAGSLGVKHIAGVRGNDIGRNLFDPSSLYATRFVLERAAAIACVNRHLQSRMLRVFPDLAVKSTVINNAVDPAADVDRKKQRCLMLEEAGWPENVLITCFIGSFREKKGCLEIIEALEDLHERNPRSLVRLLLIAPSLGSTERVLIGERLKNLVDRGIVRHIEAAPREAVRAFAASADILLQPSLEDGMANALLEGMSLGLCPIVSPVFADVVGEKEGLVVLRPNRKTIADAITALSEPSVRARMSIAARRRSEAFEPQAEAAAYTALFDAVRSNAPLPAGFQPAVRPT